MVIWQVADDFAGLLIVSTWVDNLVAGDTIAAEVTESVTLYYSLEELQAVIPEAKVYVEVAE